jgi:hypothetical protein
VTSRQLRRGKLVAPFGVGAIVDFPGEALMTAGLDAWRFPDGALDTTRIEDSRLANLLGVAHFRLPPDYDSHRQTIPFVRFPQWHVCQRCGGLTKLGLFSDRLPACQRSDTSQGLDRPCESLRSRLHRPRLVPTSQIVACSNGHMEDFPWAEWAHTTPGQRLVRGQTGCQVEHPRLRLKRTGRPGLVGLLVECVECGAKRSLYGSSGEGGLRGFACCGRRPWLGRHGSDPTPCHEPMQTLQRGASNMYFANVATSILIPPYSRRLRRMIDEPLVWQSLTDDCGPAGVPSRERIDTVARMRRVSTSALAEVVESKLRDLRNSGRHDDDRGFRSDEYLALRTADTDTSDELLLKRQSLSDYSLLVRSRFEQIVLVKKLTETRALTGFWRVNPTKGGEHDSGRRHLSLEPTDWLPAIQVRGEGVFFTLDRQAVEAWQAAAMRSDRGPLLARVSDRTNHDRTFLQVDSSPMLVLVHTLAHLLIRRLSYACGYGTAALAERLYVSHDPWMCGALIYTAAGDADGTLGGVVSQGRAGAFDATLEQALAEAEWCSSDPVCRESTGQGVNSLNLAACHTCALLPETTCELGNRLLDRIAVARFLNS